MAVPVTSERVMYLLDPIGASRRSAHPCDRRQSSSTHCRTLLGVKDHAFTLPWTPAFLNKHGGLVLSIGQFNQWVGSQLMATGLVQIWPGTPVAAPLFKGNAVKASASPIRAWTNPANSCRWLHARNGRPRLCSPSSATARSAQSARPLDENSACPQVTRTASGPWA
jgi:hypothetical protein